VGGKRWSCAFYGLEKLPDGRRLTQHGTLTELGELPFARHLAKPLAVTPCLEIDVFYGERLTFGSVTK
jgi:hypothetical protein